ncbi:MAG: endonuclease III [Melioribacteraceae bacterium]|nr:endonuclease III [Melioribacteraceae bacterium]MCF8394154.1 endonuclease III [Melioribacteraceae bacterium]MCF8418837.1 endonuclease III [Melioribacteraceae bacterium]
MPSKKERQRAKDIIDILKSEYPAVQPALEYTTAFQLLIATILSAQCTDERVNIVTKDLFKKYKKPEDYLKVPQEELEKDIFSTGFYRQKAKSIRNCCSELIDNFDGEVPENFDDLTKLSGVGRKTASVVAGNAFGIPSIAVDTHVKRLSNLLGFVKTSNPEKIEMELKELLPKEFWINTSHWLATHGRRICIARRPKCGECVIGHRCPSFNNS